MEILSPNKKTVGFLTVHDADATVHALMQPGGKAFADVAAAFPETVIDGRIDRRALRRGAAIADQPVALAPASGRDWPISPSEARRAFAQALGEATAAHRHVLFGVDLRVVAQPELDGIDAGLLGQFIDRGKMEKEERHPLPLSLAAASMQS